ncbi:MAG TPA: hypothetical protein VMU59_04330 [Caulobacteraceae bacterium]|nr:hypothetical protein [Caulobacteraceae bacterium]
MTTSLSVRAFSLLRATRKRGLLALCAPLLAASALIAGSATPATAKTLLVGGGPPQLPADPRIFISGPDIQKRIAQAEADVAAGKMYTGEPLVMQGPYRATMEWRNTAQKGINQHETDAELFVVIKGSGAMLLGGHLVDPKPAHGFAWEGPTIASDKVEGAVTYPIAKGDVIMIPPHTPHAVSKVNRELVLWSMHLPMPDSTPASALSPVPGTAAAVPAPAPSPAP